MIPSFFTTVTQRAQTDDWMHKSKKFMEKLRPDTTNYENSVFADMGIRGAHTLLTTVIRIDARQ
jgi:hypothetical protein